MTGRQAEQFDQAVQAMLDGRGEPHVEFSELLAVCARLRDLPRVEFYESLGRSLERMNTSTATHPYRREGFKTVTPFIFVPQPGKLLDFLEAALGAVVTHRGPAPDAGFHGEVRLGRSMVMVGGGDAAVGRELRASLHYFVEDVDAAYRQAVFWAGKANRPTGRTESGRRSSKTRSATSGSWPNAWTPRKPEQERCRPIYIRRAPGS